MEKISAAEKINRERSLPHDKLCAILHGDIYCDCGAARAREIMAAVEASKGGLVRLSNDRQTLSIVKQLERAGKLEYCGRDKNCIMVYCSLLKSADKTAGVK